MLTKNISMLKILKIFKLNTDLKELLYTQELLIQATIIRKKKKKKLHFLILIKLKIFKKIK